MIYISPEEKEYQFCPTCKGKLKRSLIDYKYRLNCKNCGFIFWNNPKPSVSVIIVKAGKILFLKRKSKTLNNYWVLPGGFIEYEEPPEQAGIREAKEETGVNIKIEKLVGIYQINNDPRGMHIDIIYSSHYLGEKIIIDTETHSAFKFFNIKNLPKLIAYKHRQAIIDFIRLK